METLKKLNISVARRSNNERTADAVECLLADTTGEMLKFMKASDVVIMGKSLAGHDEGHNLIEPALLKKPVVTGAVLRNFRFLLRVLTEKNAVKTVAADGELTPALQALFADREYRSALGQAGFEAISEHAGATTKTLCALDSIGR